MGDKALIAKFADAVARAFSMKLPDKVREQIDLDRWHWNFAKAEYDTAIKIVSGVKSTATLATMCNKYLVSFQANSANRLVTHFHRSDQLFFEIFERSKKISTKKQNLFAEWAALLDNPVATLMKIRFQELSPTYQSKIRALIPKPEKPALRLLDYLREEYKKKYGDAPSSNAKLYDIDPAESSALAATVTAHIDNVNQTFASAMNGNKEVPRSLFHGSLKSYRQFLKNFDKTQVLPLFQVIKILQTRIRGSDGGPIGILEKRAPDRGFATVEMYSMACMQLMLLAQGKLVIRANREGFTTEEADYLLGPIGGSYQYQSNIDHRFRWPMVNAEAKFSLSDMFLDLMLITGNQLKRATLVGLAKAHELQRIWVPYGAFIDALNRSDVSAVAEMAKHPEFPGILKEATRRLQVVEVPIGVGNQPNLSKAVAHVGSSPGRHAMFGRITIIDIKEDKVPVFYVEFEKLAPHLFQVDLGYIEDKVYGTRMQEIIQGFDAYWMLLKKLLEALQYAPALLTGGFSAVVTAYIKDKITEAVTDLVIELATEISPAFGEALEVATQLPAFDLAKFALTKGKARYARRKAAGTDVPERLSLAPQTVAPASTTGTGRFTDADRGLDRQMRGVGADIRATKTPIVAKAPVYELSPTLKNPKIATSRLGTKTVPDTVATTHAPGARTQIPSAVDTYNARSRRSSAQTQTGAPRQQARGANRPAKGAAAAEREPLRPKERAAKKAADREARIATIKERKQMQDAAERLANLPPNTETISLPVDTDGGRGQMHIIGSSADLEASRRNGYQVYMYENERGELVYGGLSGQTMAHRSDNTPLPDWQTRLRASHDETIWIQGATRVRVISNLSAAEMDQLEQWLIKENRGKSFNFNIDDNPRAARISADGFMNVGIPRHATQHTFEVLVVPDS